MTLDELEIGKTAVITDVGGEGALRCRLLDMGLRSASARLRLSEIRWRSGFGVMS